MAILRSLTVQMGLDNAKYRNELDVTVRKTQTGFKKMSQEADRLAQQTKKSEGQMRSSVSNISYQLQDMAVQYQQNVDIAVIAAQQLPQALVGFGAAGAVAGAAIAGLGLAFSSFGNDAGVAAEELDKMAESLKIASEAEKQLFQIKLQDKISDLYKSQAELSAQIYVANSAMKDQQKTVKDLAENHSFLNSVFGDMESGSLKNYQQEVVELGAEHAKGARELQKYVDMMSALEDGTLANKEATEKSVNTYKEMVKALETEIKVLGMTKDEAEQYLAVQQLGTEATTAQVNAIKALVAERQRLEKAPKSFGEIYGGTDKVDMSALNKYTEGQRQYQQLVDSLAKSSETLNEKFVREQELLKSNYTDYEEYMTAKMQLEQQYADTVKKSEREVTEARARNAADMLSFMANQTQMMTGIMSQMGEESSGLYKAMFIAQQAASIPAQLLAANEAYVKTLAAFPTMPWMAEGVRAMGYTTAAASAGLAVGGIFHNGTDSLGMPDANMRRDTSFLIEGGERIISKNNNTELMTIMRDVRNGNAGGMGGQPIININIAGNLYGDNETKKIITTSVNQAYAKVGQDFRSNGVLYKQVRR